MKILYFECNMGAAGDMIMSALWELIEDKENTLQKINHIGLPDVKVLFEDKISSGIKGTHARVIINGSEEGSSPHNHIHRTLNDIYEIINSLNIPKHVCENAKKVYSSIAAAEGSVHGCDASVVHFHEVGMMDAICDIVVSLFLLDIINPDRIISSPVNTGSGSVKCAHGVLPVPAPATAKLLEGIPFYKSDDICAELCTPTGAALLKCISDDFMPMPVMKLKRAGYGLGSREFDRPNCLRIFMGEAENCDEYVCELAFNIDDMTAEEISYVCEKILENGACDVFQTPVYMKKNRLGSQITVICRLQDKEQMIQFIFEYTSTIGIREYKCSRYVLERHIEEKDTCFGKMRMKTSYGYGVSKSKYEYDDIKNVSEREGISVQKINKILRKSDLTTTDSI